MMGKKIIFTDEQISWLKEHFADMLNAEVCKYLGCGETTLRGLVKRYGLKKSDAFVAWKKDRAKTMLRRYYLTHTPPDNSAHLVQYRFKKGNDPRTFKGYSEGLRKMTETRRRIMREEKARISFGLPQKTRMKLIRQPRAKVHQRYYLKKCGYILDEREHIAYYTPETRRALKIEERKRNRFYRFAELELAV